MAFVAAMVWLIWPPLLGGTGSELGGVELRRWQCSGIMGSSAVLPGEVKQARIYKKV